jgi:hypothetical protein
LRRLRSSYELRLSGLTAFLVPARATVAVAVATFIAAAAAGSLVPNEQAV